MKKIIKEIRISLAATSVLLVILCGFYPLAVWLTAQIIFPDRANGSLISRNGKIVGSRLVGQNFLGRKYFHPRPSAAGQGYDAVRSGGSNWGPTSRQLAEQVRQRIMDYRTENNLPLNVSVPADAVTTSASGLDPHISAKNAFLQAPRVAKARGRNETDIRREISFCTQGRFLGILGEPGVNVLMLNLALDEYDRDYHAGT